MFEATITTFKVLGVPCSFAVLALLSLSQEDPNSCKELENMIDAHYVTLAIKNGGRMQNPVDATFIELPIGNGLYSDEETSCKLVTRVETKAGIKHYTNGQHSLDIYLGPDKDALKAVYSSGQAHYWRATAPAEVK
jgi:hypothetical protein